ncbi:caspase, EACC1-associated type [Nocardiopsis salina]|uniref:caspase, EACC1-associated type n=1 Tax=Nocardiopsis salina TaxID=245836 RepID=UPI00034DB5E5|nr:AAA domain-containing protein [Nocardiopsis salina]
MRTAILIGVNRYDDLEDLRSPRADTAEIERALRDNGHFDRVVALTDPGRAEAMEVLEQALDDGKPSDLLFVSFSGHGLKDKRGRLNLAFRDTRRKLLEGTALSSEALKRMFEDSRMESKVLLLDCCHGGAFADGFATRSEQEESLDFERQLDNGEGTYVLAASGALEKAREGDNSGGIRPSPFSAAVVRGLSGAAPDANGDGWIDAIDLYQYVHREVDRLGTQRVTGFGLGLRGALILARHTGSATAAALPGSQDAQARDTGPDAGEDGADLGQDGRSGGADRTRGPKAVHEDGTWRWESLLDYYRDCLQRQSVLQQLPDADGREVAVCDMGSEQLLSGASEGWALHGAADALARAAEKEGQTLRYGYPAVLFSPTSSGKGGEGRTKVAPLFAMDVEVLEKKGRRYLAPVGDPELNRELLVSAEELDESDIEQLLEWFRADWGGSGVSGLADKARSVCDRVGFARVDDLVAGELNDRLDVRRAARKGAQNAAMLYRADTAGAAVKQLLGDLDHRGSGIKIDRIRGTALSSFSDPPAPEARVPAVLPVVTGRSNTAQEEILTSAMTRPLTVATGAPGTGKSELITSVVTTAVADGQSVLVASTNNAAVDEVVGRVNGLHGEADLVVRTGNKEKRGKEGEILNRLLSASWEHTEPETPKERLALHRRRLENARSELHSIGETERRLAVLAASRSREIEALPDGVGPGTFADGQAIRAWARRVEGALESRWLGWWNRWRIRRALGVAGTRAELAPLLAFLTTELEWRALLDALEDKGSAEEVVERIGNVREERREDSRSYLLARVAQALGEGRSVLEQRLRDLDTGGTGWKGMTKLVKVVRAWGTTSRSVRGVFPPTDGLFDLVVVDEASQCTVSDLIPLLYRARRALVIGDPHQLQPVHPLGPHEDRRIQATHQLRQEWLEERALIHSGSSAYHAAASALASSGGEVLWLDEHYRCHPEIVAPVNRRFYAGRLAVRTQTAGLAVDSDRAVQWIDVRGRPQRPGGRSCSNPEEAERVIELLRDLWRTLPPDADIGVVSPFAAHVREIEHRLGDQVGERIRVGTAHTFQGGECDVIVVSPAAAAGVNRGTGDWAARQQNLWNVAVTRARARLYVVGDREHWSERGGLLQDLSRATASDDRAEAGEARGRLFEALTDAGVRPEARTTRNGYTCDLWISGPHGGTALYVDTAGSGEPGAPDPGRALHRSVDEAVLFGQMAGVHTVRVPAWRCLAEPEAVCAELLAGEPAPAG